jgi:DNA mismatch endonuclease (patch repair protein)
MFVHGCFWHRHPGCPKASTPKSRVDYWQTKFDVNVARDARVADELARRGWRVETIWECECRDYDSLRQRLAEVKNGL